MTLTTDQQMLVEHRLSNDKKSIGVAYILWLFLGGLGAHRFYLGKTGSGIAMLCLTLIGMITLVVYIGAFILAAVGIWMLVDAFLIPGIVASDANAKRAMIAKEISVMATAPKE